MLYQQQLLIELLSSAIFSKQEMIEVKQEVNWADIYKEAKNHQVAPLLYNTVKYKVNGAKPTKELLDLWQNTTILSGIRQTMLCEHMKLVFTKFNNYQISFLPLKGLLLKELYPYKELRTMGDADILIHKKDFERATEILQEIGYQKLDNNNLHTSFSYKSKYLLEIHWSLADEKLFKKSYIFSNSIWENSRDVLYYDIPIRTLSIEDTILHLCIHMATHLIISGFGLRQVCDFVLFVENNRKVINWEYINSKAKEIGIDKFFYVIFEVSEKLFNIKVPDKVLQYYKRDDPNTEKLIIEILDSGIFGGKDASQIVKITAMQYNKNQSQARKTSKINYLKALLFPSSKIYTNKYNYVRKYPILAPVFWVHHFINGLLRKDFLFKEKLISIIKAPGDAQRKQELLEELGLL